MKILCIFPDKYKFRYVRSAQMPSHKAELLKRQQGECRWCGLHIQEWDVMEVDRLISRALGGKNEWKNLQLLH